MKTVHTRTDSIGGEKVVSSLPCPCSLIETYFVNLIVPLVPKLPFASLKKGTNTAWSNVNIDNDAGTVNTIAHEIGHNFGSSHDGGNSSTYSGT